MTIDDEFIRAAARRIVLEVGNPNDSEENARILGERVFDWTKSLRFTAGLSFEEAYAAEDRLRDAMVELVDEMVASGGWSKTGEA